MWCVKYGPEIADGKATWLECPADCAGVGQCDMTPQIEPVWWRDTWGGGLERE